jgi:S1-C subfamily serine protease
VDEQRFIAEARRILRDVDLGDISLRVTAAPAALGIPALEARITGPAGGPAGLDTLMGDGLRALDRVRGGATTLSPQERTGLEAIVRLEGRPALLVQEGDFMPPPRLWASLTTVRDAIKAVLARVGRIEVSGHPDFDWIGTGFLVARDIVMTNRHVAVEFARQSGAKWQFQAGRASSIDLREEFGSTETFEVSVKEVVGVHKTLDLALLKVEAASRDGRPLPDPLPLASSEPAGLAAEGVRRGLPRLGRAPQRSRADAPGLHGHLQREAAPAGGSPRP